MNRLVPFEPVTGLEVSATFQKSSHEIQVQFLVKDPHKQILDSLVHGQWTSWPREDELWRTTCLEAFFAVPGASGYWELNLSPSRQMWNLYWFDGYRQPQPPTPCMDFQLVGIRCEGERLSAHLRTELKLNQLEVGLCAVIRRREGLSYFALDHGPKPDFHRREAFRLRL